ncbi:TIR domain-containing protein [Croceivirga thetidis]|uniref:TIR domain-containing protein n=1 Tax=Croceivirga thetidis TaxID=2721623 RepID=A0ABX1GMD1_9FLAO|nr:TIR domain-containing protein [Croceivirga thetidis]NKI30779.1 TIR domain-containing protein [Croceivirga thetidis]
MEYLISKLSMDSDEFLIESIFVSPNEDNKLSNFEQKNRAWLVNCYNGGHSIRGLKKEVDGVWYRNGDFSYDGSYFKWGEKLPKNISKRNVFVSYYHNDDQVKRQEFDNLFGDLIINQSVMLDEIDGENSDEYIHRLINEGYMKDTTVLAVLLGPKTKCRKHVDWEIGGALNRKVGDRYSGLLGIRLPSHPDYGFGDFYTETEYSERLMANINSGYAVVVDWTKNRRELQDAIELAFLRRSEKDKIVNTSIKRLTENLCE